MRLSVSSERADIAQHALGTIGAWFVRVTTTLALTIDVFAFAIRQILQQVLQAAFAPIGQLGGRGHRLDLLHDGLTNELGPVAAGAIHIRNGADVGATRTILGATRFLLHVDVEASIHFVAFSATNAETAHAALVWQLKSGRGWNSSQDFALVVQFAVILEAGDDVGDGEPQALTPLVVLTESGAGFGFIGLDAFSASFIRVIRMTAAFATSIGFDAVSFR